METESVLMSPKYRAAWAIFDANIGIFVSLPMHPPLPTPISF